MLEKITTLFWYLKQPKGLTLVKNLFKRATIYRRLEASGDEATAWAEPLATDTSAALEKLFPGEIHAYKEVEKEFDNDFNEARQSIAKTPFKMGGMGNIDLLYNICEITQAKYVAETGVAYGWSSLSILLSIAKRDGSVLVSTDMPYAKMGNENFVGIVVPEGLRSHWKLYQESDISGLPKGLKALPSLDVVHYDSDKSYLGRKISFPVLYDKLREGGVFISDDIQDNVAFKHFCEKLDKRPVIISFQNKFVGAFIK